MKKRKYKAGVGKTIVASEPSVSYGPSPGEGPFTFEKVWKTIQENDRMLTEKFRETDRKFQETDKKIKELATLFTGQWGKLIESLVAGDLVHLLKARNLDVINIFPNVNFCYEGQNGEIDIIAANGKDVVVVEVKTTLRSSDITDFVNYELRIFRNAFPRFGNCKVYGAVAYLKSESNAHIRAERMGLFVIRATGNSASIINATNFRAKVF